MKPSDGIEPRSAVEKAAAVWHDRLMDESVCAETQACFSAWLDQHPSHREAYARVQRTWETLQHGRETSTILALRHEAALRVTRNHAAQRRMSKWLAIATPFVLVIVVMLVTLRLHASRAPPAQEAVTPAPLASKEYATAVGERLSIMLDDGSHVMLNSRSTVRIAFDIKERRVTLLQGQAFFEVEKDPARPFVVMTQNRRFTAVGTAFDVRLDAQRTQITMLEGVVRVEPARADRQHVTLVSKGEQLTADASEVERVIVVDPEAVTGWRRGQVFFNDTRLADAISEMNRYRKVPLVLADKTLGELRISGAFSTASTSAFPEALAATFPVTINQSEDNAVLVSRRTDR